MIMRRIIVILFLWFFYYTANAQLSTEEIPRSLEYIAQPFGGVSEHHQLS